MSKTNREVVLFQPIVLQHSSVAVTKIKKLYHQGKDWTCSMACIRTMLSGIADDVPTEEHYIEMYKLEPGPYYSKDIKQMGWLEGYDVLYGCDREDACIDLIIDLMEKGFAVMVESMYNYSHWYVLLGYYPSHDNDIEKAKFLAWDPYYAEVKLINVDEFSGMWVDGDYARSNVEKDFIAIKIKLDWVNQDTHSC